MKCYIYLFRHGATYYNSHKIFTGWKDVGITKAGVSDAKKVAIKLKNKKIDVGYCSQLKRSKETLDIILKFHPECKRIYVDKRIAERKYGALEGLKHKYVIDKYGIEQYNIWHRSYDVCPPKGESVKMVEKRVNSFIKTLLKRIKRDKVNVAISAHGNSMRPFRRYFEKFTIKKMMKLENPWDDYFCYEVKV